VEVAVAVVIIQMDLVKAHQVRLLAMLGATALITLEMAVDQVAVAVVT
jgi:hypothetical protein